MPPAHLTDSQEFYRWLYYSAAFLAAFNIVEILFLLFHKRRVESQEARKLALKRRISEALITETDPGAVLPPPSSPVDFAAYSEAAASVFDSMEGEIAGRTRELLEKFGVDGYYRGLARGAAWYKRAGAVDILAGFKLKQNREFFLSVFRSEPSAAVKYRIIFGLSFLARDSRDLLELVRLLSSLPYLTSKFTEDLFFNAINALKAAGREDDFAGFLAGLLADPAVPKLVKRDCLTACQSASYERAAATIKNCYAACGDEPELAIACLKALARIGHFDLFPAALAHRDWRVRLTAAKQAHMAGPETLPRLRELLRDPNYHVRLNAALAISRFGDQGLALLRAESRSSDKFAAGAAAYALETAGEAA